MKQPAPFWNVILSGARRSRAQSKDPYLLQTAYVSPPRREGTI
jgi:hypothetical protein